MKQVLNFFFIITIIFAQGNDTITLPEGTRNITLDNEGNIIFQKDNKLIKLLALAEYDSSIIFTELDNIPIGENCKYEINTRQEIYLLDIQNQRIILLSKDFRPLTAFYINRGDIKNFPNDIIIEDFTVNNSGNLFLKSYDKIFVVNNFAEVFNSFEVDLYEKMYSYNAIEKLIAQNNSGVDILSYEGEKEKFIQFAGRIKKINDKVYCYNKTSIFLITETGNLQLIFTRSDPIQDFFIYDRKIIIMYNSKIIFHKL